MCQGSGQAQTVLKHDSRLSAAPFHKNPVVAIQGIRERGSKLFAGRHGNAKQQQQYRTYVIYSLK